MDFSWVKQLADQTNKLEQSRQERDRRQREDNKTKALATCPFVEKLNLVIAGATEEYNKHCMFPHLRVTPGKLYKHQRTAEAATAEPDEVAYFTFSRRGMLYGIRGINGVVEFVQVPVGDSSSAYNIKLHEMGISPVHKMEADLEPETRKLRWVMNGAPLDGPAIISLCQQFFVNLIEETDKEDK